MQDVKCVNLAEIKQKCPNCNSENLHPQTKRTFCLDCGAVFRPNKPYMGRFKRHPKKLKDKVAILYSQGMTVTQIRHKLKIQHIARAVINRWLRKRGLPARPKPRLKDLECPICHKAGFSVKDGKRADSRGIPIEQRFLCRNCGSRYTLTRIIGQQKYSLKYQETAIKYYFEDFKTTLSKVADRMLKETGMRADETTIWEWIRKAGLKTRGHTGNQYTRCFSQKQSEETK